MKKAAAVAHYARHGLVFHRTGLGNDWGSYFTAFAGDQAKASNRNGYAAPMIPTPISRPQAVDQWWRHWYKFGPRLGSPAMPDASLGVCALKFE